jgi:MYXO-CTERM domain-containing protein
MRSLLAACALSLTCAAASAAIITYEATLAPAAPGATGSGSASLSYDDVAHTLSIDAVFAGLSGTSTVAHIHCCTATPGMGVALVAVTPPTLPGFPGGVTSGSYSSAFPIDLTLSSSYGAIFLSQAGSVSAAELALVTGLDAGRSYFNIHSTAYPGGELRGYFAPVDAPSSVPEPGTMALAALAGLGASAAARRRRGHRRAA